ncbi:type I polyketide synthase [Pedobacter africanus]|uniref:Amino acid adenylation domain-containing protein n=1 Tax=Pedobacter africanus TaxID=151894 RepID=A0A1W2DFN9_9SPHI|nr:type I polyketide synthase [Pedobacter africanus]SMC96273.1 amino acid adenylation domain-containing protein [Pedobacter africanus]
MFDKNTIVDLFSEQVKKTPENIAVVFEDTQLTYKELDTRSTQLARYLKKNGIKKESLVPICLDRSLNMIVGILGILKAEAAYVPIDPDYPAERIAYMLDDIGEKVVITQSVNNSIFSERVHLHLLNMDTDWHLIDKEPVEDINYELSGNNLAYIIYTSGSTGRPKGVMITHWNVYRLFINDRPLFDFNETDVWTMFHSFCFDFSVWEMYGALLYGGKLVVVSKDTAKDAGLFTGLMIREGVTILNQTPSAFYILQEHVIHRENRSELKVRYVIFGGEALNPSKIKPWYLLYPHCRLINMYGITETTVHVTYQQIEERHLESNISVIGGPIPTLYAVILDEQQKLLEDDRPGELYVGGDGLARGYLNLPELTASRFIKDPFSANNGARLYRTGDLAKKLPDGTLEYLGRIDDQVKIRGFRIELGEIEHVMQQAPGVRHAIVIAREHNGDNRLIGYVVPSGAFDKDAILYFIQKQLPDYMVPQLLVPLKEIPLTSNGKVNKKSLPNPDASELLSTVFAEPKRETEIKLATIWKTLLGVKRVGAHDNFFELGGNSLLAQKTVAILKEQNLVLPVTKLYQYPTVAGVAAFIDGRKNKPQHKKKKLHKDNQQDNDVAIIGMAGRFPGADSIEELWEALIQGKELIHFFKDDELDSSIPPTVRNSADYVKARGIINHATDFDASFFGITPKHAELMDPQHRVFLEICWEALERTGYMPQRYEGAIGVYAGCANNTYLVNNVIGNAEMVENAGGLQVVTVNDKDYISTRAAYALDLKGPAVTVLSACSTSLLAVAQAVESIRKGQCDVAIAGGVSITSPINSGHLYEEGAMLSKDGHCKPFDADARGTLFSDGAGVVVLKSKKQAEVDGDLIFAVIKGVGLSNDGGKKGSFTAPSAEGQAACITMALEDGGIAPSTVSYIEAHGTATPLGDPIEIEGLKLAFGETDQKQYCAIGSVKSNLGHLTHAAGVAGLIKTTLALYHKQIPASINYSKPNPYISFSDSPFIVNDTLKTWQSNGPRRAGVSSFGVGGTNVHVVLEEAEAATLQHSKTSRPLKLVSWSAMNEASLSQYSTKLASYLSQHPDTSLNDLAYNLSSYREAFRFRNFVLSGNTPELTEILSNETLVAANSGTADTTDRPITFMFPGQGAQYPGMGSDLYNAEPVFRQAMDECCAIISKEMGEDILAVIYPAETVENAAGKLQNTRYSQPALFALGYSLAKLWMSWGIHPSAFIGHSIGEFVAAHFSGIFSLEDAVLLITSRGRMMSDLPAGSMLSVRTTTEQLRAMLPAAISIAAVNSPNLQVVAGPTPAIEAFSAMLDANNIPNRLLNTSHAFHSAMMDSVIEPFEAIVRTVTLNEPVVTVASTVTGDWLTKAQATDPSYWSHHLRSTVLFEDAAKMLISDGKRVFIEMGPGTVTSTFMRQQSTGNLLVLSSIENKSQPLAECQTLLKSLGQLWVSGQEIDWSSFYKDQEGNRISDLPTYAFQRKTYWLKPNLTVNRAAAIPEKPMIQNHSDLTNNSKTLAKPMRKEHLISKIREILENASGIEMNEVTPQMNFMEAGLDSLLLTQAALLLKKEFNENITFRQLNEELNTMDALASHLDKKLPVESAPVQNLATSFQPQAVQFSSNGNNPAIDLIGQQLQFLAQQIAVLQNGVSSPTVAVHVPQNNANNHIHDSSLNELSSEELAEIKKPFGATARIEKQSAELTSAQQDFLSNLTKRYNEKTKGSKAYTQKHRPYMADPRVVSGFKPATKELVYAIVAEKSKGCRIWDIDGNEFIDALNGFGSNMLGYQPDFIKKALIDQIEKGYEIGPQHELAGEVSKLICDFSGFDRAGLCNTGSEAVLGAMRIARTVTGRSLIVAFTGSYHGIVDEVIVRGSKKLKSFPAAPGIMPEAVQNMLILDYGTEESLKIIKERAHELAAVLVEPVQSRRPEFQPIDFLKEIRKITEASKTALIFDEVVSGFRFHPGGTQAMFGIKADIATYGKVVGAGMSIGIIAGKQVYMDALDGGTWQFGDDSAPEAGVTYFAGTFVRHPLALASARASLTYMKEQGPALQENLNANAQYLADQLNHICRQYQTPMYIAQFCSVWKIKYHTEYAYSELLFTLMRDKGIHILDGFPCFLTTAHQRADIDRIISTFEESVKELKHVGLIPQHIWENTKENTHHDPRKPPVPGARLGKDREGNPAWFVRDENNPGKYLQVQS